MSRSRISLKARPLQRRVSPHKSSVNHLDGKEGQADEMGLAILNCAAHSRTSSGITSVSLICT